MNLTGQVALITGGSRGLGKAFAQALAKAGARVVITGRSAQELTATAAQIAPTPDQVVAMPADVTDPARTQQVIATVEEQVGPLDLLVNNAGTFRAFGMIANIEPQEWWREVEINLRGPFLYAHAVLPAMRARQTGRIINVASGADLGTIPAASAYNVSKTALIRLSETLAQETKGDGICVFAIHPGTVRTPMNAYVHDSPEVAQQAPQIQQWFQDLYATNRDTPIERAADLVLQIASGKADALTGCYLSVEDDIAALTQQSDIIQQESRRKLRMQM